MKKEEKKALERSSNCIFSHLLHTPGQLLCEVDIFVRLSVLESYNTDPPIVMSVSEGTGLCLKCSDTFKLSQLLPPNRVSGGRSFHTFLMSDRRGGLRLTISVTFQN